MMTTTTTTGATMNQATLIGYEWISYLDEDDKRRSDWPAARECSVCHAQIVHVYTIRRADGTVEQVGRECAHVAMGWNRARPAALKAAERTYFEKLAGEKAILADLAKRIEKGARGTKAEAARDCRARNNGFMGEVAVLTDGARFYAIPAEHLAVKAGGGAWKAVEWTCAEAWALVGFTPAVLS